MATHHYANCKTPEWPCDLDTENRAGLCEKCLTYLIQTERPQNWSPVVKNQSVTITGTTNGKV